ncbi:MAG: GGDEF domain-containing protein [Treponema sp.]|jgi:diguanylate cyclase (GGDEF)-like protein|nr:GGDEF domain-containing protein [Treponema sp.]
MPLFYINVFAGTGLITILIGIDYIRKYNTGLFQRSLFLAVLGGTFFAALFDFLHHLLSGTPGLAVNTALYVIISLFLAAQNMTYYTAVVFIDYFACQDKKRSGRFIKILACFLVLYAAAAAANLRYGFFFSISSPDNLYTAGRLYPLRLLISCFPLGMAMVDIAVSAKYFTPSQISCLVFFGILTGMGAAADIIPKSGSITWPCFAAALLYQYFFIIRSDSKLDCLTGLGNRYSFNEFVDKLTRSGAKEPCSIVMIDMDHFKEINDTLGHLEGDNALRDMAAIIKGCIRKTDFAARYGGDEFIIAARTAGRGIERVIERIEQAMDNQNSMNKRAYKLQMSCGWDVYTPAPGRSLKDFLAHVDSLMYKNKTERRQREKEQRADAG